MKRNKIKLPGNPKQNGQPVGIGKTVNPDHKFANVGLLQLYWRFQIGRINANIHSK